MQILGKHLIGGTWTGGERHFSNVPVDGPPARFPVGEAPHIDAAVQAAEASFLDYSARPRAARAAFLRAIAAEIDARAEAITTASTSETGLPAARIEGERGRTIMQLQVFADHIETGAYLDYRRDQPLPDRKPLPRPDLRVMQHPVGPVAIFGASNFPLAFSVAGGDTASALAAGCPVVVKGHEAHPATSEIVACAIDAAIRQTGMPPGVFSLVHGGSRETGQHLVTHPLIKAVGFTGSLAGGRALFDLCAQRREPIPFFGELGSVNPIFLLPGALAKRGAEIAGGWAASLTMGAGQFCTKPGIAVVIEGPEADAFAASAVSALRKVDPQVMLTPDIAEAFRSGRDQVREKRDVETLLSYHSDARSVPPYLCRVTGKAWLADQGLAAEVFGPLGMLVTVKDAAEMLRVAESLHGQLTCGLHIDDLDTQSARALMPVLTRKAGRILANGFPTGVEVAHAMVHGGPYPASTNFGASSVGTLSIRRWLRPVCYQDIPEALLPDDLR